jgi:hypothetical protein
MDWTNEAQDRANWQAFLNLVMNLWVTLNVRYFLAC